METQSSGETMSYELQGLPALSLQTGNGHRAEVCLHGATVTGWSTPDFGELLFMSSQAVFEEKKAIRGGIPLIFPQFGPTGPLPSHGFARVARWTRIDSRTSDTESAVTLELRDTGATRAIWNHSFRATYEVALTDSLTTRFQVSNTDTAPLTFTLALHTYFRVSDISAVSITGLGGLTYLDNTQNRAAGTEPRLQVTIADEIDRVYVDAPDTIELHDRTRELGIVITKTNLRDAVVWNPWIEKSKGLPDLGNDDYKHFVCVETGTIATPVTVAAGETFDCSQTLSCRKL